MNKYFILRRNCPSCGCNDGIQLCRIAYSNSTLHEYLINFYKFQGGIEFKYLQDQDYILFECSVCGLIYQKEIPNDFLMHKLYNIWIDPQKCFDLYEKSRGIEYFAYLSSEIVDIIKHFDQPPTDLKFLDFSMGWGHWCQIAQSFGCTVHGTEYSQSRIDYARSKGINVISYSEIANHRYDFINTEQVFEHLPDIRTTVNFLIKSLKSNGIIKINVPNGWNIKKRLEKWDWTALKGSNDSLNPVAPLEHINCFDHHSLIELATHSGLVSIALQKKVESNTRNISKSLKKRLKRIISFPLKHLDSTRQSLNPLQELTIDKGTYMFFKLP
ncbi:MAG TPA: class I SAM-dependent methyltransferase [Bacteroidales bacterium]|nr:class I SAM-dependent methyltransferase [Bacteroidales bacterium]